LCFFRVRFISCSCAVALSRGRQGSTLANSLQTNLVLLFALDPIPAPAHRLVCHLAGPDRLPLTLSIVRAAVNEMSAAEPSPPSRSDPRCQTAASCLWTV
jgi:hypothetical protein